MSATNGDAWRLPDGRIGTEIGRIPLRSGAVIIRLAVAGKHPVVPDVVEVDCRELKPEVARYHGARGGRG